MEKLKTCKDCKSEIDNNAKKCKHCGTKQPKHFWKSPWFYIVVIPIFIVMFFGDNNDSNIKHSETSSLPTNDDKTWLYNSDKDPMTDFENKYAILEASEKIKFDFPYNGGTTFGLQLRNKNNNLDVILTCSKCQFMGTNSYDKEMLEIRFDDQVASKYSYSGSDDNSYKNLFINDYDRLISEMKKSKKMIIKAPFHQEGWRIIEFNVSGLNWE